MIVRLRLFAILREAAGGSLLELDLPDGATVGDALERLRSDERIGALIVRLPVRLAVNREYATTAMTLRPEDELALVPPVSGGSTGVHARVADEPLSLDRLTSLVADPRAGAIVVFQGVTRAVAWLDYEAYREMAERTMVTILEDCRSRHLLTAAAAEHRAGRVPLGEAGVVVAVSAAHRAAAFAGAREAIDRIKSEAPIWKREVDVRGHATWVDPAGPAAS